MNMSTMAPVFIFLLIRDVCGALWGFLAEVGWGSRLMSDGKTNGCCTEWLVKVLALGIEAVLLKP